MHDGTNTEPFLQQQTDKDSKMCLVALSEMTWYCSAEWSGTLISTLRNITHNNNNNNLDKIEQQYTNLPYSVLNN